MPCGRPVSALLAVGAVMPAVSVSRHSVPVRYAMCIPCVLLQGGVSGNAGLTTALANRHSAPISLINSLKTGLLD